MVKKSNVLMLSYIIFLFVSICASIIFSWQGIHRISLAATIAGCFFAGADLANWYVSYQNLIIERRKEQINSLKLYAEKLLEKAHVQMTTAEKAIEMLTPYQNDESIRDILAKCERNRIACREKEKENQEAMKEINIEEEKTSKKANKSKRVQYIEIICSVSGFVVFFSLTSFNRFNEFFAKFASHATVIAFIIIMLTYFLKDYFEEIEKGKESKIAAFFEKCRNGVAEAEEAIRQLDYTDKVQELITILEKEKENG